MRFDESKIPDGPYCYRYTGEVKKSIVKGFGKKEIEYPETKACCYYKHIDDIDGRCLVLNVEIEDSCKLCKYNWNEDKVFEKWYKENKDNFA